MTAHGRTRRRRPSQLEAPPSGRRLAALSLAALGRTTLDEHTVEVTLGSLLKYREDQERVRTHGMADIVRTAVLRGA